MTPAVRIGWETILATAVVAALAVAAFAVGHRPEPRSASAAPAAERTIASGGVGTAIRQSLGDAPALPAIARRPARRRSAQPTEAVPVTTPTTPAPDSAPVAAPTPTPTPTPAPTPTPPPTPAPSRPVTPQPTTPGGGQTFDDAG